MMICVATKPITGHEYLKGKSLRWRKLKMARKVGAAVWRLGKMSFCAPPASTVSRTSDQNVPPVSSWWKVSRRYQ